MFLLSSEFYQDRTPGTKEVSVLWQDISGSATFNGRKKCRSSYQQNLPFWTRVIQPLKISFWPGDTPDSTCFNEEKENFIRNSYKLTVTTLGFFLTPKCINFFLYFRGFSQILTFLKSMGLVFVFFVVKFLLVFELTWFVCLNTPCSNRMFRNKINYSYFSFHHPRIYRINTTDTTPFLLSITLLSIISFSISSSIYLLFFLSSCHIHTHPKGHSHPISPLTLTKCTQVTSYIGPS